MKFFASLAIALLAFAYRVDGHAFLAEPPGRSSAWRYGFGTPRNYGDNEINCGRSRLEDCGVCGDPLNQNPGDNVNGGKYGTGIIVRTYEEGDLILAQTRVTANHAGWYEHAICSLDDKPHAVESCFVPLKVFDTERHATGFPRPETKWILKKTDGAGLFDIKLELPMGFTCKHCVMRSLWVAGNDWGCDEGGKCGMGFGPVQEKFYGCADIAITPHGSAPLTTTTTTAPSTTTTKASSTTTAKASSTTTAKASSTTPSVDGSSTTTTQSTTSTSGPPVATFLPPSDNVCTGAAHGEIRANPKSCCTFIHCMWMGTRWESAVVRKCPTGLFFNAVTQRCDFTFNVDCDGRDKQCLTKRK